MCDDGNTANSDGCASSCAVENPYTCNDPYPRTTKSTCTEKCGDGLNYGTYACDDGNLVDGDGCSATCTITYGWTCSGGSTTSKDTCSEICGYGINYGSK